MAKSESKLFSSNLRNLQTTENHDRRTTWQLNRHRRKSTSYQRAKGTDIVYETEFRR